MRVAFVLAALQAGGAERVIAQITRRAVARGWSVTVIAFDSEDDPIYHALDPAITVRRLALPSAGGGPRGFARNAARVRALRTELRAGRFDAIVSFLTKINVLTLLASAGLGARVIVSERNNPERQDANALWNSAVSLLYRRAARVVVLTKRSKRILPAGVRDRAVIIPNPVEIGQPREIPSAPLTLVAVGRLTPQKGFDILLEAFAQIVADVPDWRLLIWGEGAERGALEAQREALGLRYHVILPGETSVPRGWVTSASAFVLSSRYEGWANVLAEAMAAGLPVVAFDCDFGPADIIDDEVTGLLVAPEDRDGLAAALRRLMNDPGLRERLAAAGYALITQFEATRIADTWLDLIDTAIMRVPRRK